MSFLHRIGKRSISVLARAASSSICPARYEATTVTQQTLQTSLLIQQLRSLSQSARVCQNAEIFDRNVKTLHRDRAVKLDIANDQLVNAVTEDLCDRILDTSATRMFPRVAVIGGALPNTCRTLLRSGIAANRGMKEIICIDSSKEMIAAAQAEFADYAARNPDESIEGIFIHADEEWIPLQRGSVDAVLGNLGLNWYNDLEGVMIQSKMALKPDGLFLGALFGGDSLQELRIACTVAEQEREGGISARVSPLAQVRDGGNLLGRAGFNIPSVDTCKYNMAYPSALELVCHLRKMGEGNAVHARRLFLSKDAALATAAAYQALFYDEEAGGVTATFQIVYITGWKPDPSQRGPAARGSATVGFDDLQKLAEEGKI